MKTLFITKTPPYPVAAGSAQRTAILIDALSQLGEVDVFFLGYEGMKTYLGEQGYKVVDTCLPSHQTRSLSLRVLSTIMGRKGEQAWRLLAGTDVDYKTDPVIGKKLVEAVARGGYDLVVGRYLSPSAQSGMFELADVPVIVDVDDADSMVLRSRISSPATHPAVANLLARRLPAVDRWERELWQKASMLWLANPEDTARAGAKPIALIPNIPYKIPARDAVTHSKPDSRIVLWVGSFNHRVNLDGVDLFIQRVWPGIVQRDQRIIFRIVGSHLPENKRRQWSAYPNLEVVGYAESLREHYEEATLSVVPILDGAGTKIKILESLAHMRTCVATSHSIKGYESFLKDGESVRVADTLEGLVSPICELLSDSTLRHSLESNGRDEVEAHCSRAGIYQKVAASIRQLGML